MSHEYNDADWEYEVSSVQRKGVTGNTRDRRHGEVTHPEPSEDEPKDDYKEQAVDGLGIPTGDI